MTATVAELHRADRGRLEELLGALDASPSALRRDECGDPHIAGSRGHVYAVAEACAFYLVVFAIPRRPGPTPNGGWRSPG